MDFGIAVATAADSWKTAERAEALGFSHLWFYDTQMLSADCFVAMGAAALKTERIRLGTGVLIPSNRIAPVTANAFATPSPMPLVDPVTIAVFPSSTRGPPSVIIKPANSTPRNSIPSRRRA